MTRTQLRKQASAEWKEINGWNLTVAEKTARRMASAKERINQMIIEGRDASLYIDLFNEAFPENKI